MARLTFLHLSDLHIGDKLQKGLISQTKKVLFEDLTYILSKLQALDVVFFTGDFVQKGTKKEFDLFEIFLEELWGTFHKAGHNPFLLCVPGNHDLERETNSHDPIQKIFTDWLSHDIKDTYFWEKDNEYQNFVLKRFNAYDEWYQNTKIKKPENIVFGYLPGDFYTTLNIYDKNWGVVGLNSSFLQLSSGDMQKKIGIYNQQIHYLFEEKYMEWFSKQDLSILMTHHSPDWFESKSLNEFNQEIYVNESFIDHLCGHMHEPFSITSSQNGFPQKRFFITPSLFGIENYGDGVSNKRTHGYTAGYYEIEDGVITKTIFPRISIQTKSGTLKISQNEEFNIEKDSSSLKEVLKGSFSKETDTVIEEESKSFFDIEKKAGNLFAQRTYADECLARTIYKEVYSHIKIRLQEKNLVLNNLNKNKYCWISTEFGLGEDEFIGSLLNNASINPGNCFSINCDDISSIDQLTNTFNKIFSLNITKFFDIINTLDRPLLVFNNLSEELVQNPYNLKNFIETIFDFSSNLKIIIVSEVKPDKRFFESVELLPLDIPAVKQYIEFSQDINSTFTFLEFEKIHRISSGIPFYIDKIIEQLLFRPLSDLGDMEFDISSNGNADNILPKTLIGEINSLRVDDSKLGSRRFMLLSVLSLLHNGETFERIRKIDPTKPFHFDDIAYLLKNKIIETVQVNSIFEDKNTDSELVKIIKIPRIIRDYVSSLLTDEVKVDIYKMTCNLYLGSNWRNSIKLIQPKSVELDLIIYQNLQIAIRFILLNGITTNNEIEVTRMTHVAMALIEYFSDRGAYKDSISLAEEILLIIKEVDFDGFESIRVYLMKSLGENLRMTSFHDKSISILTSICDDDSNSLSKKDRNNIRLSISYAYDTLGQESEAIKYANLVKYNEQNKNSHIYLAAESVIAGFIKDKSQKISKLNAIKLKAIKFGYGVLKTNIILEICEVVKDDTQSKQLDKIIQEAKNDTYNKVRALILKAEIVLNTKNVNDITNNDLFGLHIAYSYTFYQRLQSLLNKCHKLAWQYWSLQKRFDHLLNLFRYSSFMWRLCGKIEEEKKYIDELHTNPEFIEWFKLYKNDTNGIYYEQRIFALYSNVNNMVLE